MAAVFTSDIKVEDISSELHEAVKKYEQIPEKDIKIRKFANEHFKKLKEIDGIFKDKLQIHLDMDKSKYFYVGVEGFVYLKHDFFIKLYSVVLAFHEALQANEDEQLADIKNDIAQLYDIVNSASF